MDDRRLDSLLDEAVADAPPEDVADRVNPWRRSFAFIIWGLVLSTLSFNFYGLDYILPYAGAALLLLGFRPLRRDNGFFRAAFDDNRFLLWPIRQEFANASELDKAKIIFLFAITGEDPVDESLLSDYEKDYQKRIRNADFVDPYKEWDAVVGATQVDALWGEFFARGTYKPLRRIMDLFKYSGEASYAESMLEKNKKPESPEDWRKFMLGMLNKAAMVTFAQNAYRIPLVENYCMWAIQNNDLPKISYKALSPLFNEIDENNAEQGGEETIWRIGTPKIFMPEKVSE